MNINHTYNRIVETAGESYLVERFMGDIPEWLRNRGVDLTVALLEAAEEWVTDQCPQRDRHQEYGSCLNCGLNTYT